MSKDRARLVLIADETEQLAPYRERFGKHAQFQLATTTNLAEGLMVAGAMPADGVILLLRLNAANRDTVLRALRQRADSAKIPLHWVADDATRQVLESEVAADVEIDSLLEDTMTPEEIFEFFTPDAAEEASRAPRRARLRLESAIERPAPPAPDPTPDAPAAPKRARLVLDTGAYDLSEKPLIELVEHYTSRGSDGSLRLEHKGQEARLHFAGGEPVHATFGALGGMAALVNFAHWQDGLARWEVSLGNPERSLDPAMVVGMLKSIPTRKKN
ncbi:MAG: DUF4388 domain-containing protein [Verrucomicrobia bacterium]|nr:DUF4388 domain-containing protein [Verrucomicrobiota bacterium]